ncbi:glycosyltransferase [Butyrivibrio sp. AE3004]|uniref:glycosyltransferase n=1 Tax=Butyrivibrio sp. AE3004 TaxID=1506994 RepID=UPI000493E0D8|nr:glycosyltransferase [Butyrivibrio sp. AE3004]
MSRITVVCCYNDVQQFENLKKELEAQSESAKLIGINNTSSRFGSCAAAYNSVIKDVSTPFVIYSHQDIVFEDTDNIKQLADYLEKTGIDDILGVAGVRRSPKATYTNIYHGISNKRPAGKLKIEGIEECESVDECLFGGHTDHFRKEPFDEVICNNWHLYAVEQCIRTKVQGNKVWMCDVALYHCSDGEHNDKLHENFLVLSKAYHKKLEYIATPCCRGCTGLIRRNWGYLKRNRKLGIYSDSRLVNAAFKRIDKLSKRSQLIHYCLYGNYIFK